MQAKIGYRVRFLNEDVEGIIKSVLQKNRLVVTSLDGFDYEVAAHEVVIIGEDNSHIYAIDEQELAKKINPIKEKPPTVNKKGGILSPYLQSSKYNYENTLEIDLHLEELVEFPQKLADWQKLHTQMTHVKNCLNAAMDKKIRNIIFIHGVGTGVLKTELLNYLADYDNIIVKEADFREYGMGATAIIIKY